MRSNKISIFGLLQAPMSLGLNVHFLGVPTATQHHESESKFGFTDCFKSPQEVIYSKMQILAPLP